MKYYKSFLFLMLFLLLFTIPLLAENNQKTYSSDSLEYSLIRDLIIEQGLGAPSSAGPWSTDELLKILQGINTAKLSADSSSNYTWIKERLTEKPNFFISREFSFDTGVQVTGELYLHSNSSQFFDEDEEWVQDYTKREPLLSIPFEFWGTENIYGTIDLTLRNNRFYTNTTSSSGFFGPAFSTNLIFDDNPSNVDLSFPWKAYVSVGDRNWNVQFGRDTVSWGNGSTGNMVIGNHMDYHEFLRVTTYYDPFKYSFLAISFPHPDLYKQAPTDPNLPWTPSETISSIQTFIGHRFEFLLFEKLRLSLTEGIMYQGETYDFRFFSPFVILHNYYMRGNANSILSAEVDYSIMPSLLIHAQFVMDDLALGVESATSSTAQPNAWGALAGVHYTKSIDRGMLHLLLEGAYTTPYLYLRDSGITSGNPAYPTAQPIDFVVGYQQYTQLSGMQIDEDFLGFKYGGDAIILNLIASYTKRDIWEIRGGLFWMLHGTHDTETLYELGPEAASSQTPTSQNNSSDKNAVETTFISSAGGSYQITPDLRLRSSLNWVLKWNPGNITASGNESDLQFSFGISYTL